MFFKNKPLDQRVYTTVYELPLSAFVDIVCDQKIIAMIRPGKKASDKECSDAWKIIFSSYLELVKDKTSDYITKTELRIEQLRKKVLLVTSCATCIRAKRKLIELGKQIDSPAFIISVLKKEANVEGEFNILNPEQLEKDIQCAETSIIRYQIEIDDKKAELSVIISKEKRDPINRESFMSTLVRLNAHLRTQYKITEISVYEFIKNLNDWKAEIDLINQNNLRKNKR